MRKLKNKYNNIHSSSIVFYVTNAKKDELKECAKQYNMSLSEYMRLVVEGHTSR